MTSTALLCLVLSSLLYAFTLAPLPPLVLASALLGLACFGAFAPAAAGTPAWWDWLVQAGRLVGPVLAFKLALLALC